MKIYRNIFKHIISLENLFSAWDSFKRDKGSKRDVQAFEWNLEQNIFKLYHELVSGTYRHSFYSSFYINDPKQRHIHKATVRDRVLHHALFTILNYIFEPTFIPYSFSCRIGKGTHKGVIALKRMLRKVSRNGTQTCFALKCDIKKFFDSVDHQILKQLLRRRIKDIQALALCNEIIDSFSSKTKRERERERLTGVPIGNLTSQLFANIYLNELDQFVKHELKVKYYLRYTDDFVIVHQDELYLKNTLFCIQKFLENILYLTLHPKKVLIRKYSQGIDFLGYVILPHHTVLRTKTRKRMFTKLKQRIKEHQRGNISQKTIEHSLQSYLGVLFHADAYEVSQNLWDGVWRWGNE